MLNLLAFKPVRYVEPSSFHHALCTLLITLLALISLHFLQTTQAFWLLFPCVLLSQAGLSAESSWRSPWQLFFYLICGLLAATLVFLVSLCAIQFLYTIPLLFFISLFASFCGWQNRQYFFAAFILILLPLLAAFSPASLNEALERSALIFLASFLVLSVRFFYFLYQRSHSLFDAKIIFFQKLKKLYRLIFYSSGSKRPLFSPELEESHFQIAWSDCLSALLTCKAKVTPAYRAHLDRIWDITLSLGSLRYRLTDFSVLRMSQDEIQALLKALLSIVDEELISPPRESDNSPFEALQKAIQNFETLYQSMLQTVAKEPLVLLLFIQDLYALKEELEALTLGERSSG